jgi:anti-anti-sigma factor
MTDEKFRVFVDGVTARLYVAPQFIVGTRQDFLRLSMELLEHGTRTLIVDFSDCVYLDSAALETLVTVHKRAVDEGVRFLLQNLNEDLATLFELTRLNTFFEVVSPERFDQKCAVLVPNFDAINNELIDYFGRNPERLHDLDWRAFELLLEAVFKNNGFRTELGPGRADGGVDIRLVQTDTCGELITLVQAKKYRGDRAIRLEAVQAFSMVVEDEKANRGLFVTTSRYLPSAKQFAERQRHRLTLADSVDVAKWCQIALRKQ